MTNLTRAEAAEFFRGHDRFSILTHRRPDGDTLGSAAALCLGLRKLGKEAWVVDPTEPLDHLGWLLADITKEEAGENDTIVAVDVAAPNMLPKDTAPLAEKCALRIDHHGSSTPFAEGELVDPESASCAEIVCDILTLLEAELDEDMADAIYVGLSTDTGCFRYANTTAHSLRTAAACYDAGADLHAINQALFDTNTHAKLRLQGWMAENTRLFENGTLAVCALPRQVELDLGVTEDDMENISGFPRSIEGVKMAATLRENADGLIKLSVRAVPGYDASAVCAKFGGGGHKGAAGGNLRLPLADAAEAVKQAMLEVSR